MKTVLVTGAHGFLGRNTSLAFKESGYEVVGLGHGKWEKENYCEYGIDRWIEADVTFQSLRKIKKRFVVIVHCAGSSTVGNSLSKPMEDFCRTVDTTLAVLEYARQHNKNARIVYPSSAAVYGAKADRPIREDDSLNPISPYGYHKKIAEELCESYSKNYELRISIIRFFSLYGKGLKKQLLWDACNKFISGHGNIQFYGTGEETRDWLNVRNAVSLILRMSEHSEKFGIINGAGGNRIEVKTLLQMLAGNFDTEINISFNGSARAGDPQFYHADITRALQLNWKPTVSIDSGLSKYVQWFRGEK